jgi:release factor glutamine methyltransferase
LRRAGKDTKRTVRLLAPPGVFSPLSDTRLLAERLRHEPSLRGGSVLDLCAGSGALALAAARNGARRVTAIDASRRAVLTARLNARINGVRVRALRGDLFAPVAGERFDLVASNPPYVPEGEAAPPAAEPRRGFDAGHDGRELLDRVCAGLPGHLAPGGVALLVHSSICGEDATLDALRAGGLEAEVVVRRRGPLGPVLRARAHELERRGLLRPGQRDEEVLVVRAELDRSPSRWTAAGSTFEAPRAKERGRAYPGRE